MALLAETDFGKWEGLSGKEAREGWPGEYERHGSGSRDHERDEDLGVLEVDERGEWDTAGPLGEAVSRCV